MKPLSRRKSRENAFIALFESSFDTPLSEVVEMSVQMDEEYRLDAYGEELLQLYATHADAVEEAVAQRLKGWTKDRLPRVSLAILRLAVAEMVYGAPDMQSVVINEAVELAKKYGDEGDYQFVNGVLGNIARGSVDAAPPAPKE